jgi:predicted metal-dependent HD superfamily phosphohydrolase
VDILEKSTKSISIHKLKDIIMATKHSRLLEQSATFEELLIRDLDLGILGSPREIYNQYSNAIRKEYNTVPYQIFAAKRIKVLESFLNKDRIYSTDYFYNKYENQARINLTDERRQLTASI